MQTFLSFARDSWDFIALGFRDAALSAVFTSTLTILLLLLVAKITGRRLSAIEVGGINFQFAARETRNAYKQRGEIPPSRGKILKTLETLSGRWKVLWVDDHPENNRHEMEALSAIGFSFQLARSNAEAVECLRTTFFHLVISDIGRENGEDGAALPEQVRDLAVNIPFVFYVGQRHSKTTKEGFPVVVDPHELYATIQKQIGIRGP